MLCHVRWGTNILSEKLIPEIGGCIGKTPFAHNSSGGVDFMQSLSFFQIFLLVTCILCLDYQAVLDLPKLLVRLYWSEKVQSYLLVC